jgi:hypothetical protein
VGKAHGGAAVRTGAEDGEGKMGKGEAMKEQAIRAAAQARLTLKQIRDLHSEACQHNPLVAIMIEDLIVDARKMRSRLEQIAALIE